MARRHNKRGCALLEAGKVNEAIKEFQRAVEIAPSSPEAYGYLGMAYEDLCLWNQAAVVYRKLVRLRPIDAEVHYRLGMAYNNLCQWEEAAKCFKEAARLTS